MYLVQINEDIFKVSENLSHYFKYFRYTSVSVLRLVEMCVRSSY